MRDFGVKQGISAKKKNHDSQVKFSVVEGKMHDFRVKWGVFEEEMLRFRLNWVFSKPKCTIFT